MMETSFKYIRNILTIIVTSIWTKKWLQKCVLSTFYLNSWEENTSSKPHELLNSYPNINISYLITTNNNVESMSTKYRTALLISAFYNA